MDATGLSELLILEDSAGKWAWDREGDDREGTDYWQKIVEEVGLDVDLDTPFLFKASLNYFVCVLNDVTVRLPRALWNYRVRSSESRRCSIREAIHATLADGIHLPSARSQGASRCFFKRH
ncbi:hypothetical protein DL96DRAFT_1823379 [Flagelloscypha sp. PMI_526]|nr:hypothetical protein DL96DRAFT_1823379 [Flagelloscypha sp. PMI_526]